MIERFGYVAILGRPNVGKSTLFNAFLGKNLSVVTRKAQTTQARIMGVVHKPNAQFVMFDTPGVKTRLAHRHLGHLNREAQAATYEAHCALFIVSGHTWQDDDAQALEILQDFEGPVIAVINKLDRIPQDANIEETVTALLDRYPFEKVVTVSAKTGTHVALLEQEITMLLPKAEQGLYAENELTTHTHAFMLVEIIRGKLLENVHEEIPYVCSVTLDQFVETPKHTEIHAVIWVRQESQKSVVIGKAGSMLKRIGVAAREQMEKLLEKKVVLKTWVKVGTPQDDALSKASDFNIG